MVAVSLSYKKGSKLNQIISINPHFTFNRLAQTPDCHIFELKCFRWPIDMFMHKDSEEATQREFALFYLRFTCM
jgi:hypothetical protein